MTKDGHVLPAFLPKFVCYLMHFLELQMRIDDFLYKLKSLKWIHDIFASYVCLTFRQMQRERYFCIKKQNLKSVIGGILNKFHGTTLQLL